MKSRKEEGRKEGGSRREGKRGAEHLGRILDERWQQVGAYVWGREARSAKERLVMAAEVEGDLNGSRQLRNNTRHGVVPERGSGKTGSQLWRRRAKRALRRAARPSFPSFGPGKIPGNPPITRPLLQAPSPSVNDAILTEIPSKKDNSCPAWTSTQTGTTPSPPKRNPTYFIISHNWDQLFYSFFFLLLASFCFLPSCVLRTGCLWYKRGFKT